MSRPLVSDWMRLNTGNHVTEIDGRHVGRVDAILNSSLVKVRWLDSGWVSYLELGEVVRVPTSPL